MQFRNQGAPHDGADNSDELDSAQEEEDGDQRPEVAGAWRLSGQAGDLVPDDALSPPRMNTAAAAQPQAPAANQHHSLEQQQVNGARRPSSASKTNRKLQPVSREAGEGCEQTHPNGEGHVARAHPTRPDTCTPTGDEEEERPKMEAKPPAADRPAGGGRRRMREHTLESRRSDTSVEPCNPPADVSPSPFAASPQGPQAQGCQQGHPQGCQHGGPQGCPQACPQGPPQGPMRGGGCGPHHGSIAPPSRTAPQQAGGSRPPGHHLGPQPGPQTGPAGPMVCHSPQMPPQGPGPGGGGNWGGCNGVAPGHAGPMPNFMAHRHEGHGDIDMHGKSAGKGCYGKGGAPADRYHADGPNANNMMMASSPNMGMQCGPHMNSMAVGPQMGQQQVHVRQDISQSSTALADGRQLVETAFGKIGDFANQCCLLLAQPEFSTPNLRALRWANRYKNPGGHAPEEFFSINQCTTSAAVVLVTSVGNDTAAAEAAVRQLNSDPDAPVLMSVLIVPESEISVSPNSLYDSQTGAPVDPLPARCIEVCHSLAEARSKLFGAGVDDVIGLLPGQVILPHRIIEAVERTEFLAQRAAMAALKEINAMKETTSRKLQVAFRRFLWSLPGSVLESTPVQDPGLPEQMASNGQLLGVGPFQFQKQLGKGSFGFVFRAFSPTGVCAVKVTNKESVKTVGMLFSFDREVCLMQQLEAHPHVVKLHTVMHGRNNLYAIMEYAGENNLHMATKKYVASSAGAWKLPGERVNMFAKQMTSAFVHLHNSLICHRDVKPTNWIVSDVGDQLRLADFGLAAQMAGPRQRLKQACGSLPFVAPEVYGLCRDKASAYNGLKADIWSLALNFVELCHGPYSIERSLDWVSARPTGAEIVLRDLETLAQKWANGTISSVARNQAAMTTGRSNVDIFEDEGGNPEVNEGLRRLQHLIGTMLHLEPDRRSTIADVAGPNGLQLPARMRGCHRNADTFEAATQYHAPIDAVHRHGATIQMRALDSDLLPDLKSDTLLRVLGGVKAAAKEFGTMLDAFRGMPGFSAAFDDDPSLMSAARSFYTEELPPIFACEAGGPQEQAIQSRARAAHVGLSLTDTHLSRMFSAFASALNAAGVAEGHCREALSRLDAIRSDVLDDTLRRAARSRQMRTPSWYSSVLPNIESDGAEAFGRKLYKLIASSEVLANTAVQEISQHQIAEFFTQRFRWAKGPEHGRPQHHLPFPPQVLVALSEVQHLVLVHLARDALQCIGWGMAMVDVMHIAMLEEWERDCGDTSSQLTLAAGPQFQASFVH